MKNRFLLFTLAVLTMSLFVALGVRAQDDPEAQPQTQEEQTGVGRLSVIHGGVSTMHGDAGDWVAGVVNAPLVPGDKVATADRARAEVQLDYANIIRLDQRTEAQIAQLTKDKIDIQLASGLVDFSVFQGTQADAEIDTPNMGVHPLSPGIYRVQVNSATDTQLIVRQGEAEVLTNQGSTKVAAGQIIQIHGGDNPEYKIDPAPAVDDFERWCANRDRQIQTAQAWQHTDQYYTGASDLDAYGQWDQVPDYGWCWTPAVDAGWVPYSSGRWGWEPYWGWTWISYEPWGWAPYHYGRWFMYGNRWRWWPARGFYGPHPIWSPAYVSFFGFGGRGWGVGAGFGFGSIGWLPLGPRDVFHPWFGRGHGFTVVNINNFHGGGFVRPGGRPYGSNLARVMTDPRMRGAITHVSSHDFVNGRVSRSAPVSENMLRGASMVRGTLPVAPTRASLGNRVGNFSGYRISRTNNTRFFSRGAGTAGRNYNFHAEAGQIRDMAQRGPGSASQVTGRPGGNMQSFGARTGSPAPGRVQAGQPAARGATQGWGGFQRGTRQPAPVNAPATGRQGSVAAPAQGNQRNWDRYASPNPYRGRAGSGQAAPRGGWQGYSNRPQGNQPAGGGQGRSYERPQGGQGRWNAPAPRSGGSYNRGNSRPPLQLNRPIMRERSRAPEGGGRGYSAPARRGGGNSAPRGGGGGGRGPGGGSRGGGGGRH